MLVQDVQVTGRSTAIAWESFEAVRDAVANPGSWSTDSSLGDDVYAKATDIFNNLSDETRRQYRLNSIDEVHRLLLSGSHPRAKVLKPILGSEFRSNGLIGALKARLTSAVTSEDGTLFDVRVAMVSGKDFPVIVVRVRTEPSSPKASRKAA